ncbi:hypothetical protein CERSUDRAFT_92348 [Gelatoporia subvermispora B]|uniref:Heterokaryon incompatibility domain-containing protein n=1 Tax=Ceriporiopsis subvermispora (strain B) TaxID=914234 RepID=M2RLW6_CERS8|nr:hypothetical protein CERSUDRAFT_92348 [Gelatoporia subvermispora B]
MEATTNFGALIARDAIWLGGPHDGYPLAAFRDYENLRLSLTQSDAPGPPQFDIYHRAALTQCWFTFGFLEAVTEGKISEGILVRQLPDGTSIISTRNISNIICGWTQRIRASRRRDPAAHHEWFKRTEKTIQYAHQLLMLEVRRPDLSPFRLARLAENDISCILYMIAAIGEVITETRREFLLPCSQGFNWSFILGAADLYREQMTEQGWCPFTIKMLSSNVCVLGFASMSKPSIRGDGTKLAHSECTSHVCDYNNLDGNNYTNQHATPACTCAYSKPHLDQVIDHLSNSRIPVVQAVDASYKNDPLEIACLSSADTAYVAISHVWADGLGSTTEAGLPTCQLRRVSALAQQLVLGGAFWMDALCVPQQKAMRKRAIGLMAQTYKDATVVLVLDSGIRTCSVNAPLEEKLLRVMTSGWMQRIWTLQEAILARKLIFEFSDGQILLQDLIPRVDDMDIIKTHLAVEIDRLSKRQTTFQIQFPMITTGSNKLNLGDVARSLRGRTTSKPEDETLAISGLLDVNAAELVDLCAEQRMTTFLLRVREVASNIIFLDAPKLQIPGFRWAPTTLTAGDGPMLGAGSQDAECTSQGLLSVYQGVYFQKTTFRAGEWWYLHDPSGDRILSIIDRACLTGPSNGNTPAEYTIDMILFPGRLTVLQPGIAVLVESTTKTQDNPAGWRAHCRYVTKLSVTLAADTKDAKDARIIVAKGFGRLPVCVS